MNGNGNGKTKDISRAAVTMYGRGVKRGNPKRCIACGQVIQRGDDWRVDWSEQDPKLGRYAVIQHEPKCPHTNAARQVKRMLRTA